MMEYTNNTPIDLHLAHGTYTFALNKDFVLESGKNFGPVTIDWESYGVLNKSRDNAILICHALTGNAHVAGKLDHEARPGWWDPLIGPGKPLDTNNFFIICSNILGGCSGSTGPSSINPETEQPYALSFPTITIRDMINAQKVLIQEYFGIEKLYAVVGGSIGGMQVLEWAVNYPNFMEKVVAMATSSHLSPQAIAFNKIGRHAIRLDPKWNHGNYYHDNPQLDGLALARMVAHITYLSEESFQHKFGREHCNEEALFDFEEKFEVENYLDYQGYKFVKRFDANSYLYLSKAMDLFDLSRGFPSLEDALKQIQVNSLFISFTSDWLFPPKQMEEMYELMCAVGKSVEYHEIETYKGHDAFLIEYDKINPIIQNFIND